MMEFNLCRLDCRRFLFRTVGHRDGCRSYPAQILLTAIIRSAATG
jgi:hypothetical protein